MASSAASVTAILSFLWLYGYGLEAKKIPDTWSDTCFAPKYSRKAWQRTPSGSVVLRRPILPRLPDMGMSAHSRASSKRLSSLAMGSEDITLYAIYKLSGTVNFVDFDGTAAVTRGVDYTFYNNTTGATVTAPAQNGAAGLTSRGWGTGTAANAPALAPSAGGAVPLATTILWFVRKNDHGDV
jgi:hypothetical protein